ncbi:hypothetical protein KKF84_09535 [Myxococcota bacterium]|nr:hypothetical protein [Myxococcota bacterium]MBU1535552.1 hypothetical protein [Myxococcota bacterium]
MKKTIILSVFIAVTLGIVVTKQQNAGAKQVTTVEKTTAPTPTSESALPIFGAHLESYSKKCSFNSDCPYGKCKHNKCGSCSFNSDCKGWGKCKSGRCGGCSFNSDCKGFGKCSSGKCTKSPY